MEDQVLALQELPQTDEDLLEPAMCCDTGRYSGLMYGPPSREG